MNQKQNVLKRVLLKRYLPAVLSICMVLAGAAPASAASGDPALRFGLSSSSATAGLKTGDQVEVRVKVGREDGSDQLYQLASIMLDISFDNELFEVSQLKPCGLKRPDGANWIGGWTCSTVPGGGGLKRVRVLYLNMTGLMSDPPKLDGVSGSFQAASFVLTAKKAIPSGSTAVEITFAENGDAKGDKSPCVIGDPLAISFASDSNGGSGGSADGGNGQNSGGGSSSGSGSSSGGGSGTSGGSGGSSGGGSNHTGSGNANANPAEAGQNGGTDGSGSNTGKRVSFSELTDVPADHWAANYIKELVEKGILSGNENKEFQPEKAVTRAEFAQMIAASFGYQSKTEQTIFSDVSRADWYYEPVMALYEAGVAAGTGDGLFGADATLSRQDMAVILSRVMQDKGIHRSIQRSYAEFDDQNQVEDYARQALMDLYCTGLLSGTEASTLSPRDNSTRAQAATVLCKMLEETEGR